MLQSLCYFFALHFRYIYILTHFYLVALCVCSVMCAINVFFSWSLLTWILHALMMESSLVLKVDFSFFVLWIVHNNHWLGSPWACHMVLSCQMMYGSLSNDLFWVPYHFSFYWIYLCFLGRATSLWVSRKEFLNASREIGTKGMHWNWYTFPFMNFNREWSLLFFIYNFRWNILYYRDIECWLLSRLKHLSSLIFAEKQVQKIRLNCRSSLF